MIRAAILDVDGTLFDTERLFMEGWLLAGSRMGYPLTKEMINCFHGRGQLENEKTFYKWFGPDADYWGARKIRIEYVNNKIAEHGVPTKPGLFEFLKSLKEQGIRIALATGTIRAEAQPRWEKAGLSSYIEASVCGDEVTENKPNPEIFLRAASLLQTPPSECVVVEDSTAGLFAAKNAGATAIMVPDLEEPTEELRRICDRIVPNLSAASMAIREINRMEEGPEGGH